MIHHSHSLFDRRMGRTGVRLPNALSVPYRVSQWIGPPPALLRRRRAAGSFLPT